MQPDYTCYYCGDPCTGTDHTVPRVLLGLLRDLDDAEVTAILVAPNRRLTVPCCGECNSILGAKYFQTLAERKAYVKERLRINYRHYLNLPTWTEAELSTLEGRLRDHVEQGLLVQLALRRRLRH